MTEVERQLRERIEELEETIRQLRHELMPMVEPPTHLAPAQYRVFCMLYPGRLKTKDALLDAISPDKAVDIGNLTVQLYRLRRKIAPFGYVIVSMWGAGYYMTGPGIRSRV